MSERLSDEERSWCECVAGSGRLTELQGRAIKRLLECHDALRAEVERLKAERAELEGEARVLVGCPCRCHDPAWFVTPHDDCRECVRGTATPSAIDHDHEWALWAEKWTAALDLMGKQQERAENAEEQNRALREAAERFRQFIDVEFDVEDDGTFKLLVVQEIWNRFHEEFYVCAALRESREAVARPSAETAAEFSGERDNP